MKAQLDYASPEPPLSRLAVVAFIAGLISGPFALGLAASMMLTLGPTPLTVSLVVFAVVLTFGIALALGISATRQVRFGLKRGRVLAALGMLMTCAWALVSVMGVFLFFHAF